MIQKGYNFYMINSSLDINLSHNLNANFNIEVEFIIFEVL